MAEEPKSIDLLILMNDLQQFAQPSSTAVGSAIPSSEDFQKNRTKNLANIVGSIQSMPWAQTKEGQETILDLITNIQTAGPTLYKGITNWIPGAMVKGGKFVGGGKYSTPPIFMKKSVKSIPEETMWTTTSKDVAKGYSRRQNWTPNKSKIPKGEVLKFDVPQSYINELLKKELAYISKGYEDDLMYLFTKGIPKKYFKERIK